MYYVYECCTYDHDPGPGCPEWTPRFRCVGQWALRIAIRAFRAWSYDGVSYSIDQVFNEAGPVTDPGPPRCDEIPLPANYYHADAKMDGDVVELDGVRQRDFSEVDTDIPLANPSPPDESPNLTLFTGD